MSCRCGAKRATAAALIMLIARVAGAAPIATASNDPITAPVDLLTPLAGIYLVGSAEPPPFNTLSSAVAHLNAAGVSAAVEFHLTDASYTTPAETFPITIGAIPGAGSTNTFTLRPAPAPDPAPTPSIAGSSATAILILDGCDYVTVDGSNREWSSRDLTITNTSPSVSSAVIWGQTAAGPDGATHNTIRNVNVAGSGGQQTLVGIGFGGTTISISSNGAGNDHNTIEGCRVSAAQYGIYSAGSSTASKNAGTVIRANRVDSASPHHVSTGGIYLRFEDGALVTENWIGELDRLSGSNAGISLGIPPATIKWLTSTDYDEVSNAIVSRNKVAIVRSSAGASAVGIATGGPTSGANTLVNNMVSGVTSPAAVSNATLGIFVRALTGAGATNVYFNSVSMTGDRGSGATNPSYALAILGTDPVVDVRDNALSNTQTTTGTGKSYAIGISDVVFTNLVCDYNDLAPGVVLGRTGGLTPTTGTDQTWIGSWRTATGKDAHSLSADPQFVGANELHITAGSPLLNAGTRIAGITEDWDGTPRGGNTPDIGADQVSEPTDVPPETLAPALAYLAPPCPNPVEGGTTFAYGLSKEGPVLIQVFDVSGRLAKTLKRGIEPAGHLTLHWDGTNTTGGRMNAGVFFVRMEAEGRTFTRTVQLVR